MKLWELNSYFRSEPSRLQSVINDPKWVDFAPHFREINKLIQWQARAVLDMKLPEELCRQALALTDRIYAEKGGNLIEITGAPRDPSLKILTALQVFDLYGGAYLEDVSEYGSCGVSRLSAGGPAMVHAPEISSMGGVGGINSYLVEFRDNGTGHNDVHLQLGDYVRTADSYYLAIDPSMLPREESVNKVRFVLIQLLQCWMMGLSQATPARPAHLPYDFSDQYTGCLQCRPDGEFLEILPGWSGREGYTVGPSDPGDYFFGITDFRADTPSPYRLSEKEFLQWIRESIANTESQLSKDT